MKRAIIIALLAIGGIFYQSAQAQVSVNINLGKQPLWGPVGYDYVQSYYMPDMDVYYMVPEKQFAYLNNGQWVVSASLPAAYSKYDLYRVRKVVIDEARPYTNHRVYYDKYHDLAGKSYGEKAIRYSNEPRYWENPSHPMHAKWNNGKGNAYGHYKNNPYVHPKYKNGKGHKKGIYK